VRAFPWAPCPEGLTLDCVEPGGGPLTGDLDRDGTDDVLVGWGQGQTWEAFTTARGRYFFGSTVSERGDFFELVDLDDNGLLDLVVFQPDQFSEDVLMLGQELEPPPIIVNIAVP
jgi:hypothetical protein